MVAHGLLAQDKTRGDAGRRTALGFLALSGAFSATKLAVFHESASVTFLVVTAAAAALLLSAPARRFFAPGGER